MTNNTTLKPIDIQTEDGICDATIFTPQAVGKFPAVLLPMDAFGPRTCLYDMARKLAEAGNVVLLRNLFYRVKRAPLLDVAFPISKEEMPWAVKEHLRKLEENFKILYVQIKKWRYSHPLTVFATLYAAPSENLFLAGDAFGEPSLNGAARSANSLADFLLKTDMKSMSRT